MVRGGFGRHRDLAAAAIVLGILAALWLPVFAPASAASASPEAEQQFVDLATRERAANGLPGYATQGDLTEVARAHAARMAGERRLYHNPNLATDVQNWDIVGENVGRGPSVEDIHRAFMNSPSHRSEILSSDFTQVGIGVVVADDGEVWVAEVFRKPTVAAAPAAAPAPAPAPVVRQQPVRPSRAAAPPAPAAPVPAPAPVPPAPAPAPEPQPRVTDASPDLVALGAALSVEGPTPPTGTAVVVEGASLASSSTNKLDVDIPVRLAATLILLVVALQLRHVMRETPRSAHASFWVQKYSHSESFRTQNAY